MPGRNLLRERDGVVKAQGASIYILGWLALAMGIVAGAYAAGSWVGDVVRFIPELIPGLIPLALFIGFIVFCIDIITDLVPNQGAVSAAFLGPILAASPDSTGRLGQRISDWSGALQGRIGGDITAWVGNISAGMLSLAIIGGAIVIGKRVLDKQSSAAGRGGGGGR